MKSLGTLAAVLALLLPAPTRAQSVIDQKSDSLPTLLRNHGYVAIPLEEDFMSGFYTVPTTVNSTPKGLLLDSGFTGTIAILRSVADSLGIRSTPRTPTADTTRLAHFALGTMRFDSQFVQIQAGLPISDGLVGAHILSTLGAIVDYPSDRIYIDSTSPRPGTGLQRFLESRGAIAIPLTRIAKPDLHKVRYTVQASVGSTSLILVLDTGAQQDIVIDQQRADALGLQATDTGAVNMVGGSVEMRMGRLNGLALGPMHLDTLSVMVIDLSSANQQYESDGFPRIDGILGAGVLKAHHAIIDFGYDMLYLWP